MPPRVTLVLFHLTCHEVPADDDPPKMVPEDDHSHGEIVKYTCPKCHHKVTLDVEVW